jgi:Flp pilus assembly protein TadD
VSADEPRSDRNVIPRWRGYQDTVLIGELDPPGLTRPRPWSANRDGFEIRTQEWVRERRLSFAADLVGSALVLGPSHEAVQAAKELLDSGPASPLLAQAAKRVIDLMENESERGELQPREVSSSAEVARLRRSTRLNMRNAFRWAELARFFTIQGKNKKATRAMKVARGLAPHDRYILRCSARLEIHLGRSDRASSILRSAANTVRDPWLLAAALASAAAAEEPPKMVRAAEQLLASQSFSPFDMSELASALGTLEVRGGNDRAARRLFRLALADPTDNSVAQAEWAMRRAGGIALPEEVLAKAESWEARAWSAAHEGEHGEAVREAWAWHYDQPFASRPAEFGSYHAAAGADFETGAALAAAALKANPEEFLLLNNLAFCLASMSRVDEAERHINKIRTADLSKSDRATYLATKGLIAFRRGDLESGRELYAQSIASWSDVTNRTLAIIMLAREELRAHTAEAVQWETQARELSGKATDRELRSWLKHLDLFRQHRRD